MKGIGKLQKLQIDLLKRSFTRGENLVRDLLTNKEVWESFIVIVDKYIDDNLILTAFDSELQRFNALSFLIEKDNVDALNQIMKKYDYLISSVREIKHVKQLVITYQFDEV